MGAGFSLMIPCASIYLLRQLNRNHSSSEDRFGDNEVCHSTIAAHSSSYVESESPKLNSPKFLLTVVKKK